MQFISYPTRFPHTHRCLFPVIKSLPPDKNSPPTLYSAPDNELRLGVAPHISSTLIILAKIIVMLTILENSWRRGGHGHQERALGEGEGVVVGGGRQQRVPHRLRWSGSGPPVSLRLLRRRLHFYSLVTSTRSRAPPGTSLGNTRHD